MKNNEIGKCGLVCFLCNSNKKGECTGCKSKESCEIKNCCERNSVTACCDCLKDKCTVNSNIPKNTRVVAFNKAISKYGNEAVAKMLIQNETMGILYHNPNGEISEYDKLDTVDEVLKLLRKGMN